MSPDQETQMNPAPGAPMMQSPAPAPVPEASPLSPAAPVQAPSLAEAPVAPAPSLSPTEPSAPLAVPTLDPSLLQEAIADVPSEAAPTNDDAPSPFSVTAPNADFSETSPGESVSPLEAATSTEEEVSAPTSPFESEKRSTPSVAFNDPASQPDAPAPGTDPGKAKGLNLSTPEFLSKALEEGKKINPVILIVAGSAVIIIGLVLLIAFAI